MLVLSGSALADEAPPRPIASVRLSVLSGFPDVIGGSVSLTALHPVELEAGASTYLLGACLYGRGGLSFSLVDTRKSTGGGWTLRVPLLVGYRYMQTAPFDTVAYFHGATASTGLDVVW